MTDADVQPIAGGSRSTGRHRPGRRAPFRRLLSVETRKLFDTRSGRIMTVALAVLTVAFMGARGLVADPGLQTMVVTAGIGYGTLLPVIGILTVTGEWSHRTALTTFVLEPRRLRVLAAKCLPPLLTTLAASLFAMVAAVPVTAAVAAAQGVPADWTVSPGALLGWTAGNVLVVAMGLSLGMLLMNTPAAIVICLAAPMVWSVVARLGSAGEALAEWLHLGATAAPLTSGGMTGGEVLRLAVSTIFWIVLPMTLGAARAIRKEVT
ncbi:ABC transporter permease [Nonomuraea sp. KC401]|uniref:ABC transporter permease n=1 Tax=unclassified Nonomuraea TaxID=2593643 RepID=UPI0010FE6FF4|nr:MULTISPECIES: ABC transporter permease [unclassified Nonomuraea]NBE98083.1 ABC transporter permease [Nonomuraea sp. K271]TLF56859.1 ABC transporter permease [Nonomuraea sp. KC401]